MLANLSGVCTCAILAGGLLTSCETFTELTSPNQGITKTIDISSEKDIPNVLFRTRLLAEEGVYGAGGVVSIPGANYSIPVVLVRISEDEIFCFSSLCTHDNCYGNNMNPPDFDVTYIRCGCHNSKFDPNQNGKVIQGPAEKPLKQFKTEFDKTTNIVTIYF